MFPSVELSKWCRQITACFFFAVLTTVAYGASAEPTRDIVYSTVGDEALKLDAYVPDSEGPHPICIMVHGGGWTAGDKKSYAKQLYEPLCAAGYTVFSINYRLAPKYHFPAPNDDVDAAIHWAKTHASEYKGDAKRIALIGDSAGGYLVCYAGAHGKESVNAVIGLYPPTNLESRVRNTNKLLTAGALMGITEITDDTFQKLHDASPIYLIHANMPPFFILHGDKDPKVPFEQSVIFQKQMKELGNSCELVTIADGGHGLATWDKLDREYRPQILKWLSENLK